MAESEDLDRLRRWEKMGAVWRVVTRSGGRATVALCRCDGGEEADRFTTADPAALAHIGPRASSEELS